MIDKRIVKFSEKMIFKSALIYFGNLIIHIIFMLYTFLNNILFSCKTKKKMTLFFNGDGDGDESRPLLPVRFLEF